MKKLLWVVFPALLLFGFGIPDTTVVAQEDIDGLEPVTLAPSAELSEAEWLEDAKERYAVTYARDRGFGSTRMTTDVSVTNRSRNTCEVRVDFYTGNGNLVCIAPIKEILPGQTFDFCTRGNSNTLCNSICPSPGFAWEGRAVVLSDKPCRDIAVDARVMYTNSSNAVVGVSNSNVVRMDKFLGVFGR